MNIKKEITCKELNKSEKRIENGEIIRAKVQNSGDELEKIVTFMPQRIIRNETQTKR